MNISTKTGSTQKDVGLNFQHLLHFSRGKIKIDFSFITPEAHYYALKIIHSCALE